MPNVAANVVSISEMRNDRDALFRLMDNSFRNVSRDRFEADLDEKDWVIVLREKHDNRVVGFSTLMCREIDHDGGSYLVFYSGDTIVQPQYWGSPQLMQVWVGHLFAIAGQSPGREPYWMLISSGFRTYRFLSVCWQDFWPHFDCPPAPSATKLIDRFGVEKYGSDYLPESGIVRFAQPTPLRDQVAQFDPGRIHDPHVAYFLNANPGWQNGDELVCLTRAHPDNLTRAGRRIAGL